MYNRRGNADRNSNVVASLRAGSDHKFFLLALFVLFALFALFADLTPFTKPGLLLTHGNDINLEGQINSYSSVLWSSTYRRYNPNQELDNSFQYLFLEPLP